MAWLHQSRGSPRLVLVVVCVALLLDNMLLTVVVPIVPTFLYAMEHPEPQTIQPSLLALPSLSASQPDTGASQAPSSGSNLQTSSWTSQLPRPEHRALILGTEAPRGPQLPPLVSLFDNNTFDLEGVQPEATPGTDPTGWTGPTPEVLQVNETANTTESSCLQDSVFLEKENVRVGLLFASKALVQLLVNPFVGPLTNRYQHHSAYVLQL
uniref:Solute carrier family 18 member A1 n=1 Tax=Kryptolebias marmoratus TaxID=37003 RepID=A0A3Q3BG23_KRYMA